MSRRFFQRQTGINLSSIINSFECFFNVKLYKEQLQAIKSMIAGYNINMVTGEGKSFVLACVAAFLSFSTKIILTTASDVLSQRDYEKYKDWFLSLNRTVGFNTSYLDINYITVQSMAFKYLSQEYNPKDYILLVDELDYIALDAASSTYSIQFPSRSDYIYFNLFTQVYQSCKDFRILKVCLEDTLSDIDELNADVVWLEKTGESILTDVGYFKLTNRLRHMSSEILYICHILVSVCVDYHKGKQYEIKDDKIHPITPAGELGEGSFDFCITAALCMKEQLPIPMDSIDSFSIAIPVLLALFKKTIGCSGTVFYAKEELLRLYGTETVQIKQHFKKQVQYIDVPLLDLDAKVQYVKTLHGPVLLIADGDDAFEKFAEIVDLTINCKTPENILECLRVFEQNGRVISTILCGRGVDFNIDGLTVVILEAPKNFREYMQICGRVGRQGKSGTIVRLFAGEIAADFRSEYRRYFDFVCGLIGEHYRNKCMSAYGKSITRIWYVFMHKLCGDAISCGLRLGCDNSVINRIIQLAEENYTDFVNMWRNNYGKYYDN